jgi:DNA polymerase III subunit delta
MVLREARVWGVKERLFERVVLGLTDRQVAQLLEAAQVCDGLVKGLHHPDWPRNPWDGLKRLVLMLMQHTSARNTAKPSKFAMNDFS